MTRIALITAALLAWCSCAWGASSRTANFVVEAPTQQQADQIATAAEQFRKSLAIEWLGSEFRNWQQPCPITAHVGDQLGAGGATSFQFENGEVFQWAMRVQGSQERILDSVLPHEVLHTVFATHFRQPLPRWADEGACTTVEHTFERTKQERMLIEFLHTDRGIAFPRMFAMDEYPRDVMPLYSQGHSLASYLIQQKGKRHFVNYLADGLRDENWARATKDNYECENLGELQNEWLAWVKGGSQIQNVSMAKAEPADTGTKLLDFTATWCGPCQSMKGILKKLSDDGFDVVEVDCSEGIPTAMAKHGVKGFPTFIVTSNGQEIDRQRGSCTEQRLREMLAKAGGGAKTAAPVPQQDLSKAIVRIGVGARAVTYFGSGTYIDHDGQFGYVVTNEHVVRGGEVVHVYFQGGQGRQAEVLYTDAVWDLALLKIHRPPNAPEPIRLAKMVTIGDKLTLAGYGRNGQLRFLPCTYVRDMSPTQNGPDDHLWCEGASGENGDSGGPLLTESGELAGVYQGGDGACVGARCDRVARQLVGYRPRWCGPVPRQQQWSAPGAPVVRPIQPQQPIVNVPPKQNPPVVQQPPAKPCNCTGAGDCKCDPSSACKCDLSAVACKCDGKDVEALTIRIQQLELLVAALQNNSETPITLEFLDGDGNEIASATQKIKLGGTFKIHPLPVRVLRSETDYDDLLVPLDGAHRPNIDMRETQ